MREPLKAEEAIEDFIKNNPSGGPFRKQLVDWVMFKRAHGVRVAYTVREGETLMDITMFTKLYEGKGWTHKAIKDEWSRLKNTAPAEDREGDGDDLKFWVSDAKKRFRDRTHFVENVVAEGSKQVKGMTESDRKEMLDFTHRSASDFGSKFLRPDLSEAKAKRARDAAGEESDENEEENAKRPRAVAVEVALAAPKATERGEKLMAAMSTSMEAAFKKMEASLVLARGSPALEDKLQQSYVSTAVAQERMIKVWSASTLAEAHAADSAVDSPGTGLGSEKEEKKKADADKSAAKADKEGSEELSDVAVAAAAAEGAEKRFNFSSLVKHDLQRECRDSPARLPSCSPLKNGSGASASGSAAGHAKHSSAHERVTVHLRAVLSSAGVAAPSMPRPDRLMCKSHMEAVLGKLLYVSTAQELEGLEQAFQESAVQAKALKDGVIKAAKSLKDHIENKERSKARQEKQAARDAAQKVVDQEKRKAKEAADRLKAEAAEAPPLFKLNFQAAVGDGLFTELPETLAVQVQDALPTTAPALLKDPECLAKWMSSSKVQLMLFTFGGAYKKKEALKADRRVQQVVVAGQGREETDDLFKALN